MIVLFTDFGPDGPYVGQVKAVLHRDAPAIPAIDLIADAPAWDIRRSAYLLAPLAAWFPAGAVVLAVVDPGVGGPRAPVAIEADRRWYVGPDNGLLELVLRRATDAKCWRIVWQPPTLSTSFHGRDLFAPVAARLARGDAMGDDLVPHAPLRFSGWPDDLAEVIYIDHYGNAMTGLRMEAIGPATRLRVVGHELAASGTFSEAPLGEPFWYVNSNGLVEIAVNQGRADRMLGLAIGTRVVVID